MATDLAMRIRAELKQHEQQVDAQKGVIKNNLGNTSMIEAAETELKALHARLTVLKGNLKRLETQESEPA